jgi:hypothetical protein
MADPKLPGLDYETPVKIDDLGRLEAVYTEEFIRRHLATAGSYISSGPHFGILSEQDPATATTSAQPFFVEKYVKDGMRVTVHPGVSLAENGMHIILAEKVDDLELVNQEIGQQNVVFVEYVTIGDGETVTKTRYNSYAARQNVRAPSVAADGGALGTLQVSSIEDWSSNVLFPPDRRKNVTPIAVVSIISKSVWPGKEASVDLSRSTLASNRPWFSAIDIKHRSWKGTGSSSVPHNLGLNDLAQGEMTLYQQLLNHGMVIGRDRDAPRVPGLLCTETITPVRVEVDVDGSTTGAVSQRFVRLARYPVRLVGAYSVPDTTNEIAVEHLTHTNLLVIHPSESIPAQGFRVQYTTVDAGEPLQDSLVNDEVHFRQPVTPHELIVAGGKGHTEILPKSTDLFGNVRTKLSLGAAPAIPKRYRALLDSTSQLVTTPQHILCAAKLEDIGISTLHSFTTSLLGSARIRVGIFNVALNAATDVRFRLTGIDLSGSVITEDLVFNFANYQAPVIGALVENQANFQVTSTVFTSVTTIQVLSRTADGPNTAVSVYADLDPIYTDSIRDACPLAEVMWNGQAVARIRDIRPVSSRLEMPTRTTVVKAVTQGVISALAAQGATGISELLGEDLRDPQKLRASDPLRLYRFADGLRSAVSPEQIGPEVFNQSLDRDIYTTTALTLRDGASRHIHLTLLGADARDSLFLRSDKPTPDVEWRYASQAQPDQWFEWVQINPLGDADGLSFTIDVRDDSIFKVQFRIKGVIVGVSAVQYVQIGGGLELSGVRTIASLAISAGATRIVSCPFGQTLANTSYAATATVSLDATSDADGGDSGAAVRKIEKFVDHIKVWFALPPGTPSYSGAASIGWHINRGYTASASDDGYGDRTI